MNYIISGFVTVILCSFSCFSITLPWGSSSPSIENDLTVRHPEKFSKGTLIPLYLKKAEKHLKELAADKELDVTHVEERHRNARDQQTYDKVTYDKVKKELTILSNLTDRLNVISRNLQYDSGRAYYDAIKNKYFKNIIHLKDKNSDPFNLIKINEIDTNRDCLYRFLSWNWPQSTSVSAIRNMTPTVILETIDQLKQKAFKNLRPETDSFVCLIREIGSFFNDELAKNEYDAFVDGQEALDRLVITDQKTRNALIKQMQNIMQLWVTAKSKLLQTEHFLKPFVKE